MDVIISISDAVAARLEKRAADAGQPLPVFVSKIVERLAEPPTPLEELSGEVGRQFIASGISEEELTEDLERAKHELRAERRARQASRPRTYSCSSDSQFAGTLSKGPGVD